MKNGKSFRRKWTPKRSSNFALHNRRSAYIRGRRDFYNWEDKGEIPRNPFVHKILRGDWTSGFCDASTYYRTPEQNMKHYAVKNLERAFMESIS